MPRLDGGERALYFEAMAVLPIIIAPDPRLKRKAEPVAKVDAAIRRLMDDLLETMHAANGVGLAAPQVGILKRVIVVDIARKDEPPMRLRMANPETVWASEELVNRDEGCLSFPEQFAEVRRPAKVRVRYLDHENEIRELEAEGLLAICVQHEMDHLDGVLLVDRVSGLKRDMILRRLAKAKRLAEADSAPA